MNDNKVICYVVYDYNLEDCGMITQSNLVEKKDLESFLCNLKDKGYTHIEYSVYKNGVFFKHVVVS